MKSRSVTLNSIVCHSPATCEYIVTHSSFSDFYKNNYYYYYCCKWRVVNDHIDGHYELHLLIFKISNGSSYYEAYKRLLTPHVRASREKERKILSLILSLSLFPLFSQLSSLISSSLLYIKVRYTSSLLL